MKTTQKLSICTLILISGFGLLSAQKINIVSIEAAAYTPGSGISVIINPTDTFAISNTFKLELSDASGSWAAPTVLAQVNEFYTPVINATLPTIMAAGRYKLRVHSTQPEWIEGGYSIDVVDAPAVTLPKLSSSLPNNSVYFNCISYAGNAISFGSLSQDERATTRNLLLAQRTLTIQNYNSTDLYNISLVDIQSNNQRELNQVDGRFFIPDDLKIGTYVVQVKHTANGLTSVWSVAFLFHGNGTSLGNSTSEEICMNSDVDFTVDTSNASIGRNYKGSKYSLNFGDASIVVEYTQMQLMLNPRIQHVFTKPSCSETGSSFLVKMQLYNKGISNSCGFFVKNGNGVSKAINVSAPPVADFKSPISGCLNKSLVFENLTIPGFYGKVGCKDVSNFYWSFRKAGSTDFQLVTEPSWIDSKNNLTIPASAVTVAGCWEVKIEAQNQDLCQAVSVNTKTVMVEPAALVAFETSADSICTDAEVQFTNKTNLVGLSCSNPSYTWSVKSDKTQNANGFSFSGGTTAQSVNATIKFNLPGKYAISLKVVNSCGTVISKEAQVFVAGRATVTFPNKGITACVTPNEKDTIDFESAAYKPYYNVNYGTIGAYKWTVLGEQVMPTDYEFIGGTTAGSAFPVIVFKAAKAFKVSVEVQSACAQASVATMEFNYTAIPEITNKIQSQKICSATKFDDITLTSTSSDTQFVWKVQASDGLSGDFQAGSGNVIPGVVVTNNDSILGTLVYKVTANNGSCNSSEFTYVVYVQPALIVNIENLKPICLGADNAVLKVVCKQGTNPYTLHYQNYNGEIVSKKTIDKNDTVYIDIPTGRVADLHFKMLSLTDSNAQSCPTMLIDSVIVHVVDNPIINTQPVAHQTVCKGAIVDALWISLENSNGIEKINWYSNTVSQNYGGKLIEGADSLSFTPTTFNQSGDYYYYGLVTINGSNCGLATSNVAHVQVIDDPIIKIQPLNYQLLCKNNSPQPLQVKPSGGVGNFSYQWYKIEGSNLSNAKTIANATDAIYLPETSIAEKTFYLCLVSQSNLGCSVWSDTAVVEVAENARFVKQPLSQKVCLDDTAPVLRVSYQFGIGKPQYQWFESNNADGNDALKIVNATSDTLNVSSSVVGKKYYFCEINFGSDGCGNLVSKVAEINVTQYPVVHNYRLEILSGLAFQLIPENDNQNIIPTATTYTWDMPVVIANQAVEGMQQALTPQNKISNTLVNHSDSIAHVRYTIIPANDSCWGQSFVVDVIVLPALKVNVIKNNISCFGEMNGSLDAIVLGGVRFATGNPYRISWVGPNGFTSNDLKLTGLSRGEYTLQVEDASGKVIIGNYMIDEPEKLAVRTDNFVATNCNGANSASISITALGGNGKYNYKWLKNDSLFSTKEDLDRLGVGIYTLIVADENACSAISEEFVVTEFEPLTIQVLQQLNNSCFGANEGALKISAHGGSPFEANIQELPYIFAWKGPNGFSSNLQEISQLAHGEYNLTVTDAMGCTATSSIYISESTEIKITATTTPVSCFGKSDATISLHVSGGKEPYEANWSNFATGLYQENVSAGTYDITITDANSCQKTISVTIVDDTKFTVYPEVKNVSCFGEKNGYIHLKITSLRNEIRVKWLDGSKAGNERNNLAPGIYKAEISDGGPCFISGTYIVNEPSKIVVKANIQNAFECETNQSGAIHLDVSGGAAPYTFQWSNGATQNQISNLLPGKYFVVVTDSNGCQFSDSYELIRPEPLKVNVLTDIAFSNSDKKFKQICTAKVQGGLTPYRYSWSVGSISKADSSQVETFVSQAIELVVTDASGCSVTYYFNSKVPQVTIQSTVVDCNKQVYQFNLAEIPSSFTNLTYKWDFGDGITSNVASPTHVFLHTGDQKITVQIISAELEMNFEQTMVVEALPTLKLNREPLFCNNDSVELVVSGAHSYIWDDGTKGNRRVIAREGNYYVIGISANGCSSTLSFTAKHYDSQDYSISTDKNVLTLNDPTLKVWSDDIDQTKYTWEFGDETSQDGNYTNHTYDINSPVTVNVKLHITNPDGCQQTIQKTVWLVMETIPNTFTPNSDGTNDRFLKGSKTQIFNANGIILYEGTEGWDGTYKGKKVSSDTYYYIVYYATPEGIVSKPGFVFLAK
ncbi:MAG: hypothetical protein AUK44_06120 [Porphyromonadaceae bacterium CG2_30_38_12]|nr:MAG: hypothetical protein AUK44_06120 [Porphyromonadaceae bacterium CG2_30_38_12]